MFGLHVLRSFYESHPLLASDGVDLLRNVTSLFLIGRPFRIDLQRRGLPVNVMSIWNRLATRELRQLFSKLIRFILRSFTFGFALFYLIHSNEWQAYSRLRCPASKEFCSTTRSHTLFCFRWKGGLLRQIVIQNTPTHVLSHVGLIIFDVESAL